MKTFDQFIDTLTDELIEMPDADVLDGADPEAALKKGQAIFEKAKDQVKREQG